MAKAATWLIAIFMGFFNKFFSNPAPVECRHDDLIALINRLLDENKELQERLLPKPVTVVERHTTEGGTEKSEPVSGWKPPRQRVRAFIQSTDPVSSLPLLSQEDRTFLENSRQ